MTQSAGGAASAPTASTADAPAHSGAYQLFMLALCIFSLGIIATLTFVRLDPATRKFVTHPLPVPDAVPYVVRVDTARGRIWVGTSAADAVFSFEPEAGRWATYPLPSRGALVRHMAVDERSGDVWLAYGASPGIPARVARLSPR